MKVTLTKYIKICKNSDHSVTQLKSEGINDYESLSPALVTMDLWDLRWTRPRSDDQWTSLCNLVSGAVIHDVPEFFEDRWMALLTLLFRNSIKTLVTWGWELFSTHIWSEDFILVPTAVRIPSRGLCSLQGYAYPDHLYHTAKLVMLDDIMGLLLLIHLSSHRSCC